MKDLTRRDAMKVAAGAVTAALLPITTGPPAARAFFVTSIHRQYFMDSAGNTNIVFTGGLSTRMPKTATVLPGELVGFRRILKNAIIYRGEGVYTLKYVEIKGEKCDT